MALHSQAKLLGSPPSEKKSPGAVVWPGVKF
jgi:hypothetical protein